MKPILKWAGGKTRMLKHILPMVPDEFNNYIEPFVGGGALLISLHDKANQSFVNDINPELISMYKVVKESPEKLIKKLIEFREKDSIEFYNEVRSWDRDDISRDDIDLAARTIYLNKAGYGGLYRVNSKGQFNVPFAKKINGKEILNEKNIIEWSKMLNNNVSFFSNDFEEFGLKNISKNDLVFLDPPYFAWSKTANFTAYTKNGFTLDDQKRLLKLLKEINSRGAKFILTNSGTEEVRNFYSEFNLKKVPIVRTIASNGKKSGYSEYIVTNY